MCPAQSPCACALALQAPLLHSPPPSQSLDPSAHDLAPDQLLLLTRAAIIVSVHGAALNNMVWMRPHRGAVVELSAGGNYHYANMAAMLGHRYVAPQDGAPGNVAAGLRAAMDHVATRY